MIKFIPNFLRPLIRRLRAAWFRRFFYLAEIFAVDVPVHPISWVPDGFIVRRVGASPLHLVENFCTPQEAGFIAEAAKALGYKQNSCLVNDVSQTGVFALGGKEHDADLLALLYRCRLLFGVPYNHCNRIIYAELFSGADQDLLSKQRPSSKNDRSHVITVYLGDVETGGETVFAELGFAITPHTGRAVGWSQQGDDEWVPLESVPPEQTCKCILQFWFADQPVIPAVHDEQAFLQARKGVPLSGEELIPDGVWAPQDIDLEGTFGQPDKLKGLV
ncbi:MAG: hypothetical protein ACR2QG_04135 [Gammaproteobacteria bacterium]